MGLTLALPAPADDQPQWGQAWSRNQVSSERNLPAGFDPKTGRNVKWTAALGTETHSTPVIAGGRVLIGTNNGNPRDPRHEGDRSVLMCLDEANGELTWQLVVPKLTTSIYWDWPKAGICSVPSVEGERVYVVSNRGEVLCLDLAGLANGNDGPFRDEARHAVPEGEDPLPLNKKDADILWAFDIIKECGVRQHDQANSSILIHGNYLYVNTSNGVGDKHKVIHAPEAPSLIVLDKHTGELVATDGERIGPRIFHSTWSSPAVGKLDGTDVIVFCGGDGVVYAFHPVKPNVRAGEAGKVRTLEKLWSFDCDPDAPKENVSDYLRNRKVSPSNILSMPVVVEDRVYVTVGGDLWWGKDEAWLKCIHLAGKGDVTGTAELWSLPLDKHSMSTAAVSGDLVFAADCRGNLHCADALTGMPLWTHKSLGSYWASPYVADGKVFIATRSGQLNVLAAARKLQVLTELDLDDKVSSTVVAANGTLYVATMETLYAVRADRVH